MVDELKEKKPNLGSGSSSVSAPKQAPVSQPKPQPQAQPKPAVSKPAPAPTHNDNEQAERAKASKLFGIDLNKKVAPEPSWLYATGAEKNGNFNYSDARKNGFKHPTTGKESSDLYFNNNYTGPGYSAFEGLQPMEDPNNFSQNFEESFYRFPSEEKGSRGRPMVGEQKFYEDNDENVWDALREAKENASDTDTVRDIISRASKESGIDEDRLLNALIFQHLYFGSKFAFRPETNYKKLSAKQDKNYRKYLPPQWRKK